jgi:hypothetical protein
MRRRGATFVAAGSAFHKSVNWSVTDLNLDCDDSRVMVKLFQSIEILHAIFK